MQHADRYDVVVVGYGLAGQAAAALLSGRGHRVLVLERWPTLYGRPRVATLHGEVCRILQAASDVDHALRHAKVRNSISMANEAGEVFHSHRGDQGLHLSGFPLMLSIHQPDIEDAMDERVRHNGADVLQGWELRELQQDEGGVILRAVECGPAGDVGHREVCCRYVIGCDGAHSRVRELLGIGRETWPFRGAWHAIDTTRRAPIEGDPKFSEMTVHICAPEGRARSIIPLGTEYLRFTFEVDPDADNSGALDRQHGYRLLRDNHGLTEADVEIRRQAIFTFEGKLAHAWRRGNVFLAGDAAHLMTPFLGEGGCSALRDAINLSWKLDVVLRGRADPRILDTYESERRPHVRAYIDGADELAATVFIRDPALAAQRDRQFMSGGRKFHFPIPSVGEGLFHQNGGQRDSTVAIPGPQGRVEADGVAARLDDLHDWGFQVLGWESDPRDALAVDQVVALEQIGSTIRGLSREQRGQLLRSLDDQYASFFGSTGAKYVVVRPDFLTFATAADEKELREVVDALLHQLETGAQAV